MFKLGLLHIAQYKTLYHTMIVLGIRRLSFAYDNRRIDLFIR